MRKLLAVLFLSVCLYAQTHTEVTVEDAQTVSGNKTFSGNFTATAGQNTLNFYNHNNILWVGATSPYKYTTLETGITATECPVAGCNVNLVNNFAETFTAPITVGNNSTNRYAIEGYPNSGLNCNNTSGTNCFIMQRNTAITGQILGGLSALAGLTLTYPSTANIANFITTNDGVANYKGYVRLANFEVNGNLSATVSNAVIDFAAVSNQSEFRNVFVSNFGSTIGVLVRSVNQTNGVAGPLNVENVWTDPGHNAGAKPCVLQAQGNGIGNINWMGGTCNHPGSAQTMFLIDGGGVAGQLNGVNVMGTYLENSSNGGSIGFKLVDADAIHISGNNVSIRDTDTAVDISQTVLHGTSAVQVTSFHKTSPTNAATTINNHITGFTSTKAVVPFYSYGGDAALSVMPFTIESNDVQILDGANHQIVSIPAQTVSGVNTMTFANASDSQFDFKLKGGLTANVNTQLDWVGFGGSNTWQDTVTGGATPNRRIIDATNSLTRMDMAQNGNTTLNSGNGASLLCFNCTANSGTSGVRLQNGGATPATVASISGAGLGTFNGGLVPGAAAGADVGTTALPWANLWLGTAATNNYKFQPGATSGARIITITDPVSPTTVGLPLTIGSGTATMTTAAITAGNCGTTVTVAATGVATTDSIAWAFNAAPAGTNAGLVAWPTANNVNFAYCGIAETPAAATINWRVIR